jgi:MFS family permease
LGPNKRIPLIMTLLGISAIAVIMVFLGTTLGTYIVLIGVALGVSAQLASIGTMHAAVLDRAPKAVAKATGITMTGYYLGALLTPPIFGIVVDRTGTYSYSWLGIFGLLLLAIGAWHKAGKVRY